MIRTLSTTCALVALTGCVSVLPEQKVPDGLYRFGPMDAAYTLEASVMVREPEASRLVAGRAIASEDSTGALRLVPGVEWADSSTRMMQVALLDLLEGEGANSAVAPGSGTLGDYELTWRVTDFTLSGETGRCRISASLMDGHTRQVISHTTISTSAAAAGRTNADRARALTAAGQACVQDVAAFVAEHAVAAEPDKAPAS